MQVKAPCNVAAANPTYPLYPTACFLSAVVLLFVLLTSFIRQNWNLGVAFLCFWLFIENLTEGINAVVWSNNFDVKFYIYCDIVTHMQLIVFVVKPMATLIIIRRLYLITNLQSVELPNKTVRRRNAAVEWTLCLAIPLLVAGPIYYIVQGSRFLVIGGLECLNIPDDSVAGALLVKSWAVTPPLVSIVFYYPRVIRILYRQKREMDHFLQSNNSVSRVNYYRIFALASIDVVLTLRFGILNIVLVGTATVSLGHFPIYNGWSLLHTNWKPVGYPYAYYVAGGTSTLAQLYFAQWTSPVLAFVIFGLFGATAEARSSYWHVICIIRGKLGWRSKPVGRSEPGTMDFGEQPWDSSIDLDVRSDLSVVNVNARGGQIAGEEGDICGQERKSTVGAEKIDESGQEVIGVISSREAKHATPQCERGFQDISAGLIDAAHTV